MTGQSYTSTSPLGRTACTEPQCLYKGALFTVLYCPVLHCSTLPPDINPIAVNDDDYDDDYDDNGDNNNNNNNNNNV